MEPTRSQNITVTWRRSTDVLDWVDGEATDGVAGLVVVSEFAPESFCPQFKQNFELEWFALPQDGQRTGSAAPQAVQNLPTSGVSARQIGHSTGVCSP